jgi:hypothetical protein
MKVGALHDNNDTDVISAISSDVFVLDLGEDEGGAACSC